MHIKVALDLYDRHLPFFLGTVRPPEGISMEAMEVGMVPPRRHGVRRHARMLHDMEFDFSELSLVSYIMAKSAGSPMTAIPVFPRRLFSQNHIWVRSDSGLTHPKQLIGKRVLVWAFQVTMSVLAKGDMKREYGVDWREIQWITQYPEEVAWQGPKEVSVVQNRLDKPVWQLLQDGDVDAYINPHPPVEILEADGKIRRLFLDAEKECSDYVKKNGFMPIMHLIGVHPRVSESKPDLLKTMMKMWQDSLHISQDYYTDPNFTQMPFGRNVFDHQRRELGSNLWRSGFSANRDNIERFIEDCRDQVLIKSAMKPESLFHPSVLDT